MGVYVDIYVCVYMNIFICIHEYVQITPDLKVYYVLIVAGR